MADDPANKGIRLSCLRASLRASGRSVPDFSFSSTPGDQATEAATAGPGRIVVDNRQSQVIVPRFVPELKKTDDTNQYDGNGAPDEMELGTAISLSEGCHFGSAVRYAPGADIRPMTCFDPLQMPVIHGRKAR